MFSFEYRKVINSFEICISFKKESTNQLIRFIFTVVGMNEKYIRIVLPEIKEAIKSTNVTGDVFIRDPSTFKSRVMLSVFSHIKAVIEPHGRVSFTRYE